MVVTSLSSPIIIVVRPKLVMLTTYLTGGGVEAGEKENKKDFALVRTKFSSVAVHSMNTC